MEKSVYRLINRLNCAPLEAMKQLRDQTGFSILTVKSIVNNLDGRGRGWRKTQLLYLTSEQVRFLDNYFEIERVEIPATGLYYVPPGTYYTRMEDLNRSETAETKSSVFPVFFPSAEEQKNHQFIFRVVDSVFKVIIVDVDMVMSILK